MNLRCFFGWHKWFTFEKWDLKDDKLFVISKTKRKACELCGKDKGKL